MFTCTSKVHHGDTRLTATGTGVTRQEAFTAAVEATDVGYRPNPRNIEGALELLGRWDVGGRPPVGRSIVSDSGFAYLSEDPEGPRIEIGWCDFTFTSQPTVRLWAVQAQVSTFLERENWSMSRQVPTFYLDPSVQGITGPESARAVAEDIFHTLSGGDEDVRLHVTVEPLY